MRISGACCELKGLGTPELIRQPLPSESCISAKRWAPRGAEKGGRDQSQGSEHPLRASVAGSSGMTRLSRSSARVDLGLLP